MVNEVCAKCFLSWEDSMCKDPVAEREGIMLLENSKILKSYWLSMKWLQGDLQEVGWGGIGSTGQKRGSLRNHRQLTFARGSIQSPELARFTEEYAGCKQAEERWIGLAHGVKSPVLPE